MAVRGAVITQRLHRIGPARTLVTEAVEDRGEDTMEAMNLLRTRYSASKLDGPSPSAEVVTAMLEAAGRAPDHGRLRPWRLILIEGAARLSFGEILAASLARRTLLPATRPWPENARRRFARRSS